MNFKLTSNGQLVTPKYAKEMKTYWVVDVNFGKEIIRVLRIRPLKGKKEVAMEIEADAKLSKMVAALKEALSQLKNGEEIAENLKVGLKYARNAFEEGEEKHARRPGPDEWPGEVYGQEKEDEDEEETPKPKKDKKSEKKGKKGGAVVITDDEDEEEKPKAKKEKGKKDKGGKKETSFEVELDNAELDGEDLPRPKSGKKDGPKPTKDNPLGLPKKGGKKGNAVVVEEEDEDEQLPDSLLDDDDLGNGGEESSKLTVKFTLKKVTKSYKAFEAPEDAEIKGLIYVSKSYKGDTLRVTIG